MADALRQGDSAGFAQQARQDPRFRTLGENALDYAKQGITTIEEVIRVVGENDLLAEDLPGEESENLLFDSVDGENG